VQKDDRLAIHSLTFQRSVKRRGVKSRSQSGSGLP
jgi:hypothetical protein